ncbi:unnamed protein product [marine sediment metagenome]|uniref:DUF551 domain-containing protein n=1 Tax=marine sediment metagenome TaxID=412755 RepID=X1AWY9_9ZZZZ
MNKKQYIDKHFPLDIVTNSTLLAEKVRKRASDDLDNLDNWISVEDELPKESIEFNTLNTDGVVDTGFYFRGNWDTYMYTNKNITHYQPLPKPLPKPPKER